MRLPPIINACFKLGSGPNGSDVEVLSVWLEVSWVVSELPVVVVRLGVEESDLSVVVVNLEVGESEFPVVAGVLEVAVSELSAVVGGLEVGESVVGSNVDSLGFEVPSVLLLSVVVDVNGVTIN